MYLQPLMAGIKCGYFMTPKLSCIDTGFKKMYIAKDSDVD